MKSCPKVELGSIDLTPPEYGVHHWLPKAAWKLRKGFWSEAEAVQALKATEIMLRDGRVYQPDEVEDAVALVYSSEATRNPNRITWPDYDPGILTRYLSEQVVPTTKEFSETSPDPPEDFTSRDFVDMAFDNDELVCIGWKNLRGYGCSTLPKWMVLGDPIEGNLLVPNGMSAATGWVRNWKGEMVRSGRSKGNAPLKRRFLVLEVDRFDRDFRRQVAAIMMVREAFPETKLAAVAYSGGKSLHSWWNVDHLDESAVVRIFKAAVRIGVDPVTFSPIQLVRIPQAMRNRRTRQALGWIDVDALTDHE